MSKLDPDGGGAELPGQGQDFSDVSGIVLAHLLGPRLADLDAIPDGVGGDAELVDLATDLGRLEAWTVAARAKVVGVLHRRTQRELERVGLERQGDGRHRSAAGASHGFDDAAMADRMVGTDLALASGLTPWAADREVELAKGLAAHPNLARALATGRLDRRRVELILAETAHLPELADRARVIKAVVGDGTHHSDRPDARQGLIQPLRRPGSVLRQLSPTTLRGAVRGECAALDPATDAVRALAAAAQRHVETEFLPDAMGALAIKAPGPAIAAAATNVDRAARAARDGGDARTLDQLRCDIAIGWLTEGAMGTFVTRPEGSGTGRDRADGDESEADPRQRITLPRPHGALIVLTMPAGTALGLDQHPAMLHSPSGATPIPADMARRIAHDPAMSTWRALFTDPATGIATDISTSYRPPPRMRTFITLRDGLRSRLPASNARLLELDHITPYDHDHPTRGGPTTPAGIACQGRREHHLKTDGVLTVSGDANHALTYTTHTRHTYASWPEIWDSPALFRDLGTFSPTSQLTPDHGEPAF